MASPTTPMHGKLGALYVMRPNGFSGLGLNDATWGTGYNGAATGYFEVVIDAATTVDTFKWRKNGGSWTTGVTITGSAQTLSDTQTIIFSATTGHTLSDQWVIGNLKVEACTVVGAGAQITTAGNRRLNPNVPPTFTDSGGKNVLSIDYTQGKATFDGNAGTVTVTGNNGYIPEVELRKVGYLIDWSLTVNVDMAEISRMGQSWKEHIPGMAGGSGSANAYFIGGDTLWLELKNSIDEGNKYFLLELFNYDPDQDQTGDHIYAWVTLSSFALAAQISSVVKETVNFQIHGPISFTANV
jgi:hypothetical protein